MDYPVIEITENTNLINDLGFDSIDFMQAVVNIENEFDVDFLQKSLTLKTL